MFTNDGNGTGMYMPVAPMGNYYGNNGGGWGNGFGGDGAWWLLVLFLFSMNNGYGFGGGYGGAMPYIMNNTTNNDVQRGFDQQAVMSGINGISTNLCNGFAGVNQALTSGFANAEIANNARQIADMQQAFASQTAITSGMTGLQSQLAQCCCDNRLATANLNSTILAENCADRAALSDGIRDLLVNQTANTQRLVDTTNQAVQGVYNKICQLELNAKNDRIAELQAELARARSDASQNAHMSRDELMMLGQAVDILKDISTVKAMDAYGGNEDDYSSASFASRAMTRRSMDYSRGYEDGMSMAQNRSPRTGRFVSGNDGWDVRSNGYDGRSGHSINDRMVDSIERMYDNAGTEHERAEIQDVINYIRRKGMNA